MKTTYTISEAAAVLRCTPRHIRRLVDRGDLSAFNISTATAPRWRITDASLRRLALKRRHGA